MVTKIKEFRQKECLTQRKLAEIVNVSDRTIISIEKGQSIPSLYLAYRIAQVFNVSIEELCCLKENIEIIDKNRKEQINKIYGVHN